MTTERLKEKESAPSSVINASRRNKTTENFYALRLSKLYIKHSIVGPEGYVEI